MATLLGLGVTGIGVLVSAPIVMGLGGVVAVGVTGYCALKAIPPSMHSPHQVAGRIILDLAELRSIHPLPQRVGVLGPTRVGKTTLLAHLQIKTTPHQRTESPYACVVAVPGEGDVRYISFIDAAGQQYSQQFKVFDESDAVIILLDHNESDVSNQINNDRLLQHMAFLEQISHHKLTKERDPAHIHFLLNKRDLWETGGSANTIEPWFDRIVSNWKINARSTITQSRHSNLKPSDLADLVDVLRGWAV